MKILFIRNNLDIGDFIKELEKEAFHDVSYLDAVPDLAGLSDCDVLVFDSSSLSQSFLNLDFLSLNLVTKEATCHGYKLNLKRKEYDLLEYLAINKGKVVSEEKILLKVWRDYGYLMSNTVAVHILRLRKKLRKICKKNIIKTVKGFGYKLEVKTPK